EVCRIFLAPRCHATLNRILPVNIDPVKNSRAFHAGRKMPFNEGFYARANKLFEMLRLNGAREPIGLPPAAKGDHQLQVGIPALQLFKLMKSSSQPGLAGRVRCTVHAVSRAVGMIESSFAV